MLLASVTLMLLFPSNRDNLGAAKQCAWDPEEPCDTAEPSRYCVLPFLNAALGELPSLPASKANKNAVIRRDLYFTYTVLQQNKRGWGSSFQSILPPSVSKRWVSWPAPCTCSGLRWSFLGCRDQQGLPALWSTSASPSCFLQLWEQQVQAMWAACSCSARGLC